MRGNSAHEGVVARGVGGLENGLDVALQLAGSEEGRYVRGRQLAWGTPGSCRAANGVVLVLVFEDTTSECSPRRSCEA